MSIRIQREPIERCASRSRPTVVASWFWNDPPTEMPNMSAPSVLRVGSGAGAVAVVVVVVVVVVEVVVPEEVGVTFRRLILAVRASLRQARIRAARRRALR